MNEEQVQVFAEAAKVRLTEQNQLSRCVDGRYEGVDLPMAAEPGGDAGDILVALGALRQLGLSLPPEQVVDAVVAARGGQENIQFHTDDHAEHDHDGVGMGCGHLKKATLEPEVYGITPADAEFIAQTLPKLMEGGAHQEVLHGEHAEQAVIVVESDAYGLKPLVHVGDDIQEAFIYHRTLHEQHLDALAKALQEQLAAAGIPVEEVVLRKTLDEVFAKQLSATLARLASGLPVYTVSINEQGEVSVK